MFKKQIWRAGQTFAFAFQRLFLVLGFSACFLSCSIKNKVWKDDEIRVKKYSDFIQSADSYLQESDFQGTVLIARKNKIIFAKGYGFCNEKSENHEKNTIHTTYEAGSLTKQLTAAAIMQLVQNHKISLKDKVSKYFPDFEHGDKITIKMLLNMRSGLTDCINAADDFFPKKVYRSLEAKQLACQSVDENIVFDYLNKAPVIAKPDSTYFYCNTNYIILARIIEQVSGESFEKYLQKNILEKCGMNDSNLEFQKTDAIGYDYKGRYYSIPKPLAKGCGDLNSNVTDLFKWRVLLTDGKVVKKSSFKKMIKTESYGFGLNRNGKLIFHGGTTNVFNSYMSYNMKTKITVIVLVNRPISKTNATIVAGKLNKIWNEQ